MPRIIDCSIAFNEVDLFEIRRMELDSVVDQFVVVEAPKTHSGAPKSPMFQHFGDSPSDRTTCYLIEDMPDIFCDTRSNRFILEIFQRNCIMRPLSRLPIEDDDIIIISDVDEIPSSDAVSKIAALLVDAQIVILEQAMVKYFANNVSTLDHNKQPWLGSVACRYGLLKSILPQGARIGDQISPRAACLAWGYDRPLYPYERRIFEAGWHFSTVGGLEAFGQKMSAVSEGTQPAQPVVGSAPRGRHNHQSFRGDHMTSIDDFRARFCPDIAPMRIDQPELVKQLNIPKGLADNQLKFEHLFLFEDSFAPGDTAEDGGSND